MKPVCAMTQAELGEENITRIDELEMETGILRLISPTDCVKDRLS